MTAVETPPRPARKPQWRRQIGPQFSQVLVAAVYFWFLPQFNSISDVWAAIQAMSPV